MAGIPVASADLRIPSNDPNDDLTTQQIVDKETELLRQSRKLSGSSSSVNKRKLAIIQTRMGHVNIPSNISGKQLNNILPSQYNDVVERYSTRFPIKRSIHSRNYAMPNTTGRTAYEMARRNNRGNKKVRRRRKKKSN